MFTDGKLVIGALILNQFYISITDMHLWAFQIGSLILSKNSNLFTLWIYLDL